MTSTDLDHAELVVKEPVQYKPVHISIAGTPHRIICPTDAVKSLEKNAEKLNEKIRDIRREITGKVPNNEELLVLACLELYDQIQSLTDEVSANNEQNSQAVALIEKINKEVRSVLR